MLFLNLHDHGFVVAEISWGFWLVPLPLFVYRSLFLPRFLGCLAVPQRLDVGDPESYECAVAAISRQSVYLLSARLLREGGAHAVARHQGR
jgi:hypothetical protein